MENDHDNDEDWKDQVLNIPVPKQGEKMKPLGTVPCSVIIACDVQNRQCLRLLRVLFDSGSG